MVKYLYLSEHSHVNAWVNGGTVPFYPASTYRSVERGGVFTPDENLIDNSDIDVNPYAPLVVFGENTKIKSLTMNIDGYTPVKEARIHRTFEDGLVVCLSNFKTIRIARGLNKKACVRINDVDVLKDVLDRHIGTKGISKDCEYTDSHHRNVFLKSVNDSWQKEYRLYWKDVGAINVDLPPGLAVVEFFR
jgi:hypothetical protein